MRHINRAKQTDPAISGDEHYLLQAIQGDKAAFGILFERYYDEIYRYVYFRVGSQQEAEDITNEAFLKTWEYLPGIKRGKATIRNFRQWMYRVARNLVIDLYRTRETVELPENLHNPQDDLDSVSAAHREQKQLAKAIQQLPPDYQHIIILRFINQLSHQECAEIMRMKPGHTRVLQHRALRELREILRENETNRTR